MSNAVNSIPQGHYAFNKKPDQNGEQILYLVFYFNKTKVLASSGVKVRPTDWDSKKQMVKQKNINHPRLNSRLEKFKMDIEKLIESYGKPVDSVILRKLIKGEIKPQMEQNKLCIDFIRYAKEFIERTYNLGKLAYSTYANDMHCIDLFRRYILEKTGEEVFPFSNLSVQLFDEYKEYCLTKRLNSKESINKKLKPLLKTIDYATKNGLLPILNGNAILETGYFDLRGRKYVAQIEDSDVHYLTEEQMQEFVNLYNEVSFDRTREFIDIFMFSFYACGLRFSDLLTLEWGHIDWEKKEIRKNLFKGKIAQEVPLIDSAIEILERWKAKNYNPRFVFNLLPCNFDLNNVVLLDMQRKSKNRSLQTSLHELGRKLQLRLISKKGVVSEYHGNNTEKEIRLSIHAARHTWAVHSLNAGMRLHEISKLMGHKSITVTEKVYAHFLPKTLDQEVRMKANFRYIGAVERKVKKNTA